MTRLRIFMRRWRALFSREKLELDLEDEIRSHVEMQMEENLRGGMSPEVARREALRKFGGVEQVKEAYRDRRGLPLVESMWQDVRYAFCVLRKNPVFTLAALLSLSLGIGGAAVMFSLVNGALLRPLPYEQPDRLVRVTKSYPRGAIAALQERSRTMEVAAYTTDSEFNLTGEGEALHLFGSSVSANLFEVLGVHAILGVTFASGEDRPGQDRLVLLSYALWQNGRTFNEADGEKSTGIVIVSASTARRFWPGENPIGKHIRIVWEDRQWRTVVGVVGDVRQYDLADKTPDGIDGEFYLPYPQSVALNRQLPASMTLLLRATSDPSRVANQIRRLVGFDNPRMGMGGSLVFISDRQGQVTGLLLNNDGQESLAKRMK